MELANTEDEYGLIHKIFHWVIAVLIIGLLPVGLFMSGMDNTPLKFQVFALHKSFGLLVFFLGLGRIIWRFVSPPPEHLQTHKRWEVVLAGAAHFWLYVCIIGMPLSGWLMSSAGEFPIPFFGIHMPSLMGKNEQMAMIYGEVHEALAYTLLFVLFLHIAGALKHHVIDKDETLERMAFRKKGWLLPALVVLYVGPFFAVSAWLIAQDVLMEGNETEAGQQSATNSATGEIDTSKLPEHGWAIVPAQSKLLFRATLYNTPFTGEFRNFSGEIIFNPDDLSTAKADIRIGMKDVLTGDADRDANIQGSAWFDTASNPESRFVATKFEHGDGNNYVAIGNLTVRGVTMPAILPFTLDIQNKIARVKGEITLNRLNFGMGTGEWENEATVGHDVVVTVDLTAIQ